MAQTRKRLRHAGWAGVVAFPVPSREARWIDTRAGGEATRALTSLSVHRVRKHAVRVQPAGGARHNAGCANPKGAKAKPQRLPHRTQRQRSEWGNFVQPRVMFNRPQGDLPRLAARARRAQCPPWPVPFARRTLRCSHRHRRSPARALPCRRGPARERNARDGRVTASMRPGLLALSQIRSAHKAEALQPYAACVILLS